MNNYYLIINVGSTSVKSRLFDQDLTVKALLNVDYGLADGLVISGKNALGELFKQQIQETHDAKAALDILFKNWQQILTTSHWSLSAIGHRIVHGGAEFNVLTPLNHEIMQRIAELDNYAPLHNPLNRLGVRMASEAFPMVSQFAVFDTAFHHHIPAHAGRYAIPDNLSANVQFYRYGFHGISCQHSLAAVAKLMACDPESLNLIILHLGGGASVTAVRNGISVDTSMGFSPTEGLIMASRCGDLDSMIPITLQREGMSWQQVDELVNHRSGLLGICGETDMRVILHKIEQQDANAILALDMFCYRVKKYIGAYCAVLGDVSALIFTGGIGEHTPMIREKILDGLEPLGFALDATTNFKPSPNNSDISMSTSHSRIFVITAEEEREIARQILLSEEPDSTP
ncbi:MAG: acetate/propionate family kinase [Methylococcales bacterium]